MFIINMRPSIRHVAELAQVSSMTVSHAINGRKQFMSAETYERVLNAVQELNYVPVRAAKQNHHVETRAIGIIPFHADPSMSVLDYFTQGGIYEGARKNGYDVLVMLRDEADWMVNRQDMRFLDRRSDGFIFVSGGLDEWQNALSLLQQHKIPTVVCYRRDVAPDIAWVDPDNEQIINSALECLWRHGHRRVAYLGSPDLVPTLAVNDPNWLVSAMVPHSGYDDIQRRTTFRAAIEKQPWEQLSVLTATDHHWKIPDDVLAKLLADDITGVVCSSDFIALQFIDLATKAGVRVPQDISVIGTDDMPEAAARNLTSVAFGYKEVGRLAVEAWIKLNSGKPASECNCVVPVHLVERGSVAAPRKNSRTKQIQARISK